MSIKNVYVDGSQEEEITEYRYLFTSKDDGSSVGIEYNANSPRFFFRDYEMDLVQFYKGDVDNLIKALQTFKKEHC